MGQRAEKTSLQSSVSLLKTELAWWLVQFESVTLYLLQSNYSWTLNIEWANERMGTVALCIGGGSPVFRLVGEIVYQTLCDKIDLDTEANKIQA